MKFFDYKGERYLEDYKLVLDLPVLGNHERGEVYYKKLLSHLPNEYRRLIAQYREIIIFDLGLADEPHYSGPIFKGNPVTLKVIFDWSPDTIRKNHIGAISVKPIKVV